MTVALAAAALGLAMPGAAGAGAITPAQVRAAQARAAVREAATERAVPAGKYALWSTSDGWRTSGPLGWASGYAAGLLWMEYHTTGGAWWRQHALTRQKAIGAQTVTPDSLNLGSLYYATFARGHKLTGEAALKETAMNAAASMAARYSPTVGAMRSRPSDDFNIIMDSIMKLPLLYWAVENGGAPEWEDVAHRHALTMARDFIRPDGSTYHVVNYDAATGAVIEKTTSAGIAPESMWARGQAWAINGFAAGYRKTGDPLLLDAARRVADRYLADLPADLVPYWDFRDPAIPNAPRDSSAASIAASGLVDLAVIDPEPARRLGYATAARRILGALSTKPYVSLGSNPALIRRATVSYWREQWNVGAAYGDYFYLEALLRLRMLSPDRPPLHVRNVRTSAGDGAPAVDGDLGTFWKSSGRQRLDLRLPTGSRVSGVRLAFYKGDRRAARLRIRVSRDGAHWTAVKATMSSGETTGFELYDFARRGASWVRIEVSGTSMGRVNTIAEAEVY